MSLEISIKDKIKRIFSDFRPNIVINLAAQAGVRYSLSNPHAYIESNVVGFLNILEESRINNVKHLIFASSSSVSEDSIIVAQQADILEPTFV